MKEHEKNELRTSLLNMDKQILVELLVNKIQQQETDPSDLLNDLFNHIGQPSKCWPQLYVGRLLEQKTIWTYGGVDDEFREYLIRVEKYLKHLP